MATYRIQRKLFDDSDQNQQQQSSTPAPTQSAFSTDTKKELKTAAIAGGGLITLGSGILLAKNGKLGFNKAQREAAKKTYENLARKLKNTLSEEAPKFENEKKFGGKGKKYTGKGLGGGETSPGKKKYTNEDLVKETSPEKKYTGKGLGGGETSPGKKKYTGKNSGGGETNPGKKKYTNEDLVKETSSGKEKYYAPKERTAFYNKEDWKKILDYSKKNNRTRSEAVADLNIRTAPRKRYKK